MPRKQEYLLPSGNLSRRRDDAILITPQTVKKFAEAFTSLIPGTYFVGTARKESGFAANEIDTEESGYVSKGLCQLSDDEATDVGMKGANLLDPVVNLRVMVKIAERNLNALSKTGLKFPDAYAYLGIAHNEGLAAAIKTIKNYGMDWAEYKRRNLQAALKANALALESGDLEKRKKAERELERVRRISSYGDACIDGGH